MYKFSAGCLAVAMCCVAGLVAWYLYSMFEFYHGWMRLDPLCHTVGAVRVVDDRYTREAAEKVRAAIADEYLGDVVFVDEEGTVFIRPAIFIGDEDFLDRFGQWALKPEGGLYSHSGPGITCEELQPFVRSPIDMFALKTLDWPFSFYVWMHYGDYAMWEKWRGIYRCRALAGGN